jgi:hypothetical protein
MEEKQKKGAEMMIHITWAPSIPLVLFPDVGGISEPKKQYSYENKKVT